MLMKADGLSFWKFHGTGNDFVLLDNRQGNLKPTTEQVEMLCRFHTGIGADGLIMLERDEQGYRMRYYNSDGALSSFCGNGSRCFMAFARLLDVVQPEQDFEYLAADGVHQSRLIQEQQHRFLVETRMQMPAKPEPHAMGSILQTGSPHLIVPSSGTDFESRDFHERAAAIRYSDPFKAEGINVNWLRYDEQGLWLRTYERGVERETLSCGTAAVAAAFWFKHQFPEQASNCIPIQTAGGTLTVIWDSEGQIWLRGPVEFTFQGTWQGFEL